MGVTEADGDCKKEMDDSGCVEDGSPAKKMCTEQVLSEEYQRLQLLDLPDDALLAIFQFCDAFDLKALAFSCRRLAALVRDRTLWRRADARSRPVGRSRLQWITNALGEGTTELLLSGYAREVKGCLGHVIGDEKEDPGAWGDIGSDTTERSADTDDNAGPSTSNANRGEPPYPLHRQHARIHINAHPLPRMSGTPTWADQYTTVDDENATTTCVGPQFTVSRRAMQRITRACPALTSLSLEYCNINCAKVSIGDFPPTLKKLSLRGTKCFNLPTDKTYLFKIQDNLPLLELLDISECLWFEPASLLPLSKARNLETLLMRDCLKMSEFVAYASLAARYGFRRLKKLDMRGSPVGDSEVSGLGWVPLLEELYLSPPRDVKEEQTHTHVRGDVLSKHRELEPWEMDKEAYVASGMEERASSPSSDDEVTAQQVAQYTGDALRNERLNIDRLMNGNLNGLWAAGQQGGSQVIIINGPARRRSHDAGPGNEERNNERARGPSNRGRRSISDESRDVPIAARTTARRRNGVERKRNSNEGRRCKGEGGSKSEQRRNSSERVRKSLKRKSLSQGRRKSGGDGNNAVQKAKRREFGRSKVGKPARNRCQGLDTNGEEKRKLRDDNIDSPKLRRGLPRKCKKQEAADTQKDCSKNKKEDKKKKSGFKKNDCNDKDDQTGKEKQKSEPCDDWINENKKANKQDGSENEFKNSEVSNEAENESSEIQEGIEDSEPSSSTTHSRSISDQMESKELNSDDDSSDSSDSEIHSMNESKRKTSHGSSKKTSGGKYVTLTRKINDNGTHHVTFKRDNEDNASDSKSLKRQKGTDVSCSANFGGQHGESSGFVSLRRQADVNLPELVDFRRPVEASPAALNNQSSPSTSRKILNFQNDVDPTSSNYVTFKRQNNPDGSSYVTIKRKIEDNSPSKAKRLNGGESSKSNQVNEGESSKINDGEKVNNNKSSKTKDDKNVNQEESGMNENQNNNQEDNNNRGERDENSNSVRPAEPVAGPSHEPFYDPNLRYCVSVIEETVVCRERDQPDSESSSSDTNNANEANDAQNRPRARKRHKKSTMIMFRRAAQDDDNNFVVPRRVQPHREHPRRVQPHREHPRRVQPQREHPRRVQPHREHPRRVQPHREHPRRVQPQREHPRRVQPQREHHRLRNQVNVNEDNPRPGNDDYNANNAENIEAEPRHHILYVNVSHQLRAIYRLNRPVLAVRSRTRSIGPIFTAHIEYDSLVSDSAIRRFGRGEDGNDFNFINIGPNGPIPENIGARPDRSNLRVLVASGYRHITNRSLMHLATSAPHLQRIDFTNTNVTEAGVQRFKSLRPDVEVIFSKFEERR